MNMYDSIQAIVDDANEKNKPISELIIEQECQLSGADRETVWNKMAKNLEIMRAAV